MKPITVFLDNSDYSDLSNPRLVDTYGDTLKLLQRHAASGLVSFYFSGAMLSEVSPLPGSNVSGAMERARVLAQLCGRNALISYDKVLRHELARLIGIPAPIASVYSDAGEWFPDTVPNLVDEMRVGLADVFREKTREVELPAELNRKQRRAAKRRMQSSRGKAELMAVARQVAQSATTDELSARLPIKPEYAKAVAEYCARGGSRDAAVAALKACFVDPNWMMGWFAKHPDDGGHFSEWVREPARKVHVVFEEFRQVAETLRAKLPPDQAESFPALLPSNWGKQVDSFLERFAALACLKFLNVTDAQPKAQEVINACPGLSLSVMSFFSVWRDPILFSRAKSPKRSAFVDSLHSVYAPYVDVFRSDQGMSHHARALLQGSGTEVVSTLRQLPEVIARRIAERQNPS
jgi:hypothetical protein